VSHNIQELEKKLDVYSRQVLSVKEKPQNIATLNLSPATLKGNYRSSWYAVTIGKWVTINWRTGIKGDSSL